jgi:hypothetical protein
VDEVEHTGHLYAGWAIDGPNHGRRLLAVTGELLPAARLRRFHAVERGLPEYGSPDCRS